MNDQALPTGIGVDRNGMYLCQPTFKASIVCGGPHFAAVAGARQRLLLLNVFTVTHWQMQFPGCYVDDSTLLIAIVNHPLTNDNNSEPQGPFDGQRAEPGKKHAAQLHPSSVVMFCSSGHVDFLPQSVKNRLDGTEYEEGSIARNWFGEQPASSASDAMTADWLRGAPEGDETIANWLKGWPGSSASDIEIAEWARGREGAAAEEEIASPPDSAELATPATEIEHQPRSTGTISDLPLDVDHIKKDS